MKLLVIENEENTASYLRKGLSEHGFTVDVARDGEQGLHLAMHSAYDLLIIDALLPGRDGWSVLGELRRLGNQSPVLFLSAFGAVADKVKALRLGADDYLVKPFAFTELVARIESLLRRRPEPRSEVVRICDLEIDLLRQTATRGRKRLDLTRKEFQLLSLLASRPSEPVSRTVMAEQIWDMSSVHQTNFIEAHIRRLRSKVDDPFRKRLIHTVRGLGYVLRDP